MDPASLSRVQVDVVSVVAKIEIDLSSFDGEVVLLVLLAAGLGVIGGVARIARFGERPNVRAIVSALFVAAVAAIAAFYVLDPTTPLKFISACIIAGYAGPAVLDGLEARFKLAIAEQKAERATKVGKEAVAVAKRAIEGEPESVKPGAKPVSLESEVVRLETELARIEALPRT
jgi:predicted MFS family arabinose efflux permease